jgi:hypothetical protein
MTDNENVVKMVDSLADGDNVAAQDAFKSALSDKIGQALDNKRQTVANDWLNASQEHEAIKDAAGLDDIGLEANTSAEEPVEIDNDEEEDE